MLEKIATITKSERDNLNEYGTTRQDTLEARMQNRTHESELNLNAIESNTSFHSGQMTSLKCTVPKIELEKLSKLGQKYGKSKDIPNSGKTPSPTKRKQKDPIDKLRTTLANYRQAKEKRLQVISDYAIMKFLKTNNPAELDPYALDRAKTYIKKEDDDLPVDIKKDELLHKKISLYELKLVMT